MVGDDQRPLLDQPEVGLVKVGEGDLVLQLDRVEHGLQSDFAQYGALNWLGLSTV